MTYLVEFPVDGGGRLLVQASEEDLPGGLELAALSPGEFAVRARESVEQAFDQVKPALSAVAKGLRAISPDEMTIEFGISLSAESGAVIAKASADVHFTVTLLWRRPDQQAAGAGDDQQGAASQAEPG